MLKNIVRVSLAAVLTTGSAAEVLADTWPSKPISIVVPFAAGGNIGADVVAKATPDIVARLSEAIANIVRQADTKKLLAGQDSEPVSSTPAEFRDCVASEAPRWRSLVELSSARVE